MKKRQDLQNYFNNYEINRNKEVLKSELRGIAGLYNDTIDVPEYVYDISNPITAMEFYESLAGFTDKIEENYKLIKEIEKRRKENRDGNINFHLCLFFVINYLFSVIMLNCPQAAPASISACVAMAIA